MYDIIISEFMDERAVASLAPQYAVQFDPGLVDDRPRLLAQGGEARAIIVRNRTRVDRELLECFPKLQAVGRLGVGLDNIDVAACRDAGIAVLPAQGGNAVAVAEYVIAGVLMLRRPAYRATERVLAGEWPRQALIGHETSGATLGLVGLGAIAREVASRARALGMQVVACDPFLDADDPVWQGVRRYAGLDEMLPGVDALSLHIPLSDSTRNLLDARRLAAMRPGSVLINSARGGVVDEAALASALRDGSLAGAMLDVFAEEPLRAGSPLEGAPNLILTPHIAGVTEESNERISWITVDNVRRVLEERA
ncbi:hydroxyacid dehydrogenase [Stutzerimonas azotifigens]|uniref:hydroxyacid dehydrogenase n=1 Tax=Stutzerimonas azotifigens TaxID=291995 RepID=UPI000428F1DD|nr:hydroxyacid dehydrogenase [Stutzerimonas azotifigens]